MNTPKTDAQQGGESAKRRRIDATEFPVSVQEKFWANVEKTPTCWNWKGRIEKPGYGKFYYDYQSYYAHRISYQLQGTIPEGLYIDHLCFNKCCVNPAHLEPVTNEENLSRAGKAKTHCKHGHQFTPENTRISRVGKRCCRACARLRWAARKTVSRCPEGSGGTQTS